ncbi:MAG: glycosyltransferase [Actinobacteria bacterium]|nr:glycosyltransferase [Actinomycetota bacterium]
MAELRFSLVVAVYNVAPYLEEFIASIEDQTLPGDQFEIIMVDDGSTDNSLQLLQDWAARNQGVTVLHKENGGQGSARNLGMKHARAPWLNFVDPDDRLDRNYLKIVADFLDANPATELVATTRVMLNDRTGELRDRHPLRIHFRDGDQMVDLRERPEAFFGSAPAGFFKRELVEAQGLEFDERIRPNFEDGHFCVRYLLACPEPFVAYLQSARYEYRQRADRSSSTQRSSGHPGRYTDVLEYGYLDVLQLASQRYGRVPLWLQTYVMYELAYYMKSAEKGARTVMAARGDVASRFHELMPRIMAHLEPAVTDSFQLKENSSLWRDLYDHAWSNENWHSDYAVVEAFDEPRNLVCITYRFCGKRPQEEYLHGDVPIHPAHSKYRAIDMFDRVVMHERIAWLDASNPVALRVEGELLELLPEWPEPSHTFTRRAVEGPPDPVIIPPPYSKRKDRFLHSGTAEVMRRLRDTGLRREARMPRNRNRFKDAWVLMDRVHDADDSGEHLFRYLREQRPDINAWFVLEEGTPDWKRLESDGFGDRMIGYHSHAWKILMSNCVVVISSHAGPPAYRPKKLRELLDEHWKFVFLQHGVIKDDLSKVFNRMPIEIFVTSTPGEQESIAGDETGYRYTTREAKLTELPRFDLVLEKGLEYPPERRDLVLIAPTWRAWLAKPEKGSSRYAVDRKFLETDFARNWLGLLNSQRLSEAVADAGLKLAFLPHPVLQSVLADLELPDDVLRLGFEGQDVRSYFARSAAFVTDFSSMAFNVAYIERPVVYFQFDQADYFGGGHFGKEGYYDYYEQGFGPVTDNLTDAEDAVIAAIKNGRTPLPEYLERMQRTFPFRDGRARERVTLAIEEMLGSRGYPSRERSYATIPPPESEIDPE